MAKSWFPQVKGAALEGPAQRGSIILAVRVAIYIGGRKDT